MTSRSNVRIAVLACALVLAASAAYALDTPTIAIGDSGHGKQVLTVTAGSSGLPYGFTVWWMDDATFASNNGQWSQSPVAGQGYAVFNGTPTLNTWEGQYTFELAPDQSVMIEIGDLRQETGVSGMTEELKYGTTYHFTTFAIDQNGGAASQLSATVSAQTTESTNCTYTQGYWKNHESAWPVMSLMLGNVNYTKQELLDILNQSVQGNGLVSLAHQLIAAKLNIANGADPSAASAAIAAADAQIGNLVVPPVGAGSLAPGTTSMTTQTLDDYNNGIIGPGHCGTVPVQLNTWGGVKALYR